MEFVKRLSTKNQCGEIVLYQKRHNKQKIIIKTIQLESIKQMNRIKREISILKLLRHPNIIDYMDSYQRHHSFYVIMEYATRGTLQDLLINQKSTFLDMNHILSLFAQITAGLWKLHSRGISHRDLTTENILLTGPSGQVVKIINVGIYRRTDSGDGAMGTINYLAPETWDGPGDTCKADIWSLGCVLYEMITLDRLFNGSTPEIIETIKSKEEYTVDLPKFANDMNQLINSMVKVNPALRPSAKAILQNQLIVSAYTSNLVNLGMSIEEREN